MSSEMSRDVTKESDAKRWQHDHNIGNDWGSNDTSISSTRHGRVVTV